MVEVKTFRILGELRKSNLLFPIRFSKEVRALKVEHALEKVYSEMGSKHRAKRREIRILKVEEVKPEGEGSGGV